MNITEDHWLDEARREFIAGGSEMRVRRCVVMHFTAGASALSSIGFWRTPQAKCASAHIVIDRDGTIYQCRPFNRTCGHAGVSRWVDPNSGKKYTGLNSCSIGIELANAGDDSELARRYTKLPLISAKHRNGGREKLWEAYPEVQIKAARELVWALVQRYNLDDITGHDCIAPERRVDPGPAFPMKEFRESMNFKGLPVVYWK